MTSDADRFWDEVVGDLRRAEGFCVPTPEELEAELDAFEADPLSDEQIGAMIQAAVSGELATWTPMLELNWAEEGDPMGIKDEVLQLNRNPGDEDPMIDELLDRQRWEELGTDEFTRQEGPGGLEDRRAASGDGG